MSRMTIGQKKEDVSPTVSQQATTPISTNGSDSVEKNGHGGSNGNGSFSQKTIAAVRTATENFFVENLGKTRAVAKRRARRLTENWERDLELKK